MKSRLFKDFSERSKEVSKYFIFLKTLEQGTIKLSMEGMNGKTKIKKLDSDLEKTLKASCFLLLYNLVESTMRNAIEAIFDELSTEGVSFDKVRPEIKKIVLKNIQKCNHEKIIENITTISVDIISACFDKEELSSGKFFSGNIDGKSFKTLASDYGFSCQTDVKKTGNGKDLSTIKSNRNDLAHGVKSFSEVGREKSADELLMIKNKVIRYLKQILLNIEIYLDNKEYLNDIVKSSIE
jgi:MAE_28990/MAE_18760-like HEPN